MPPYLSFDKFVSPKPEPVRLPLYFLQIFDYHGKHLCGDNNGDQAVRKYLSGERVMESVTRYIEKVLKLKVNRNKSAVDRPSLRKLLGFSFYLKERKARNFIHRKPIEMFKTRESDYG